MLRDVSAAQLSRDLGDRLVKGDYGPRILQVKCCLILRSSLRSGEADKASLLQSFPSHHKPNN